MASPVAKVSMFVRRPPAAVFDAFVSPEFLTKFWLSRASAPLEPGKTVTWDFMVPGASAKTYVAEMLRDRLIRLSWDDGTTVSFAFEPFSDGGTRVEVVNGGSDSSAPANGPPTKILVYRPDSTSRNVRQASPPCTARSHQAP